MLQRILEFVIPYLVGLCCGAPVGASLIFLFMVVSAGAASASDHRNSLLEILAKYGVNTEAALKIVEEGLNEWALWRVKTRPVLWKYGLDWPEYGELLEKELELNYERHIPAPPPPFAPSSIPLEELPEEQQEELPGSLETLDQPLQDIYQQTSLVEEIALYARSVSE